MNGSKSITARHLKPVIFAASTLLAVLSVPAGAASISTANQTELRAGETRSLSVETPRGNTATVTARRSNGRLIISGELDGHKFEGSRPDSGTTTVNSWDLSGVKSFAKSVIATVSDILGGTCSGGDSTVGGSTGNDNISDSNNNTDSNNNNTTDSNNNTAAGSGNIQVGSGNGIVVVNPNPCKT